MTPEDFRAFAAAIEDEVGRVVVGQRENVRFTLIAVIAGGHALLEGVPGLGKTLLVRTLAEVLELRFARVQFTPDLMPADIVGTQILTEGEDRRREFSFQPGPIFANLVLADEINRATPKTQSALLEAMQERQVTIAGSARRLDPPFFVLATQNPLEMEGTYPLPEAQLDRFLFKLLVPFPTAEELGDILDRTTYGEAPTLNRVADGAVILEMGRLARDVVVAAPVRDYAVRLTLATHPAAEGAPPAVRRYVRYGSSPRGAQALLLAAKVWALIAGRANVSFDDIAAVALPALRHRLILNFEAEAEAATADAILQEVIATSARWREVAA
jgi:MoxR-like ATPase